MRVFCVDTIAVRLLVEPIEIRKSLCDGPRHSEKLVCTGHSRLNIIHNRKPNLSRAVIQIPTDPPPPSKASASATPSACPPRSCTSTPAPPGSPTTSIPRRSRPANAAGRSRRTCRAAGLLLRKGGMAVGPPSRVISCLVSCCVGCRICLWMMFFCGPRTARPCSV